MGGHIVENFVERIPNLLICSMCLDVMNDPVITTCGHRFCRNCITGYLEGNGAQCPMDRKPLSFYQLQDDRTAKELIEELPVFCDHVRDARNCSKEYYQARSENYSLLNSHLGSCFGNSSISTMTNSNISLSSSISSTIHSCFSSSSTSTFSSSSSSTLSSSTPTPTSGLKKSMDACILELGCHWIGPLSNKKDHLRFDCPFVKVDCLNKERGCQWQDERIHLNDHKNSCPFRLVNCDDCSEIIMASLLQNHKNNTCLEGEIICQNGCDAKIKRKEISIHTTICPEQLISCPYEQFGCFPKVKRNQLSQHTAKNIEHHLFLITNKFSDLKLQNQNLLKENSQLQNSLNQSDLRTALCILRSGKFQVVKLSKKEAIICFSDFEKLKGKTKSGVFLKSEEFLLLDHSWNVGIYPNGVTMDYEGHISVFLYYTGIHEVSVTFKMSLINQEDPCRNWEFVDHHMFKPTSQNWGWYKYLSMESLTKENQFCKDGNIYLKVSIEEGASFKTFPLSTEQSF